LGSDANGVLSANRFPVSQDQRNTARGQVRFQASGRLALALGGQYGSGLPADTAGTDPAVLLAEFGPEVLDQVNLQRGRVRPNFSLDAAAQIELYRRDQRSVALETRVANLSNRVNVINFASVFSGTAVAPPRSVAARLQFAF
jgi:outer membrane receptor for Fe3+-dicitrate